MQDVNLGVSDPILHWSLLQHCGGIVVWLRSSNQGDARKNYCFSWVAWMLASELGKPSALGLWGRMVIDRKLKSPHKMAADG